MGDVSSSTIWRVQMGKGEELWTNIKKNIIISTQKELDEAKVVYYFELNLKYPEELHNAHKDWAYAPDKEKPKRQWLNNYQQSFLTSSSRACTPTQRRLTKSYDKANYVLYQRNLMQYLSAGLRIMKIHRVLKFNQSHWLKKQAQMSQDPRPLNDVIKTNMTSLWCIRFAINYLC